MGLMYQGAIAKFDRKTQKFQTWTAPNFMDNNEARLAMVDPVHVHLDGKVWIGGDDDHRASLADQRALGGRFPLVSGGGSQHGHPIHLHLCHADVGTKSPANKNGARESVESRTGQYSILWARSAGLVSGLPS